MFWRASRKSVAESLYGRASLTRLWLDHEPTKTSQDFTMGPAEKDKPYFRVTPLNREARTAQPRSSQEFVHTESA